MASGVAVDDTSSAADSGSLSAIASSMHYPEKKLTEDDVSDGDGDGDDGVALCALLPTFINYPVLTPAHFPSPLLLADVLAKGAGKYAPHSSASGNVDGNTSSMLELPSTLMEDFPSVDGSDSSQWHGGDDAALLHEVWRACPLCDVTPQRCVLRDNPRRDVDEGLELRHCHVTRLRPCH